MIADSSGQIESSSESTQAAEFGRLLTRAQSGQTEALGELLQWYTNYLHVLASTGLDRRLRRRVNPSDVVQEAMMEAHKGFVAFRGKSQNELLGWLRQILINTLHRNFARHVRAGKRDIRREISLDTISRRVDESAANLAALLPGDFESPSAQMRASENEIELSDRLAKLRPQYRDVIVFRVLQGMSFEEIGQRMDRSNGAVRMLWLRALDAFKSQEELTNESAEA